MMPPQGYGLSRQELEEALGEQRNKTWFWRILSLLLAIVGIGVDFL